MMQTYSQRLLPPFSGQIQIAESKKARALTFDGKNWEIQFPHQQKKHGKIAQQGYMRVAHINDGKTKQVAIPSFINASETQARLQEVSHFLDEVALPFRARDHYEYWLLDEKDEAPLALIFSCCEAGQMVSFPSRPEWTALPSSLMKIKSTPDEESYAAAPVNYRVERMVAKRAGWKPKARWFRKRQNDFGDFPPCLLREDWDDEESQDLCHRYIQRQAPRLLMLHGLPDTERQRLEQAARPYALEVERFFPLYPEVVDNKLITSLRVEARMRRAAGNRS